MNSKRLIVEVMGMSCEGCAIKVSKAINEVEGVKEVKVILDSGLAYVVTSTESDPRKLEKEIRNKVNKLGYVVGEIREVSLNY
ncbi:heavy metal-associated domain-containing protein [Saccharolobus sp.]|uniref:heavy-metal-associated domain-containing protein n=1 Tax=Saccharolobus sp. TaxID=2100761 RepID=UPI00317F137D